MVPEWGILPIPKKLLKQGVRDMVRISDARMSGTSYGACVLHVAPESHIGGPLAFVQTGDLIELDVPNRKLNMLVSEEELSKHRLDAASTKIRTRLHGALPRPRHPSQPRLRFRFPAGGRVNAGAGDSLSIEHLHKVKARAYRALQALASATKRPKGLDCLLQLSRK